MHKNHKRNYSIKNEGANLAIDSLLRGGYLRLPVSLAIVAGTIRTLCQERDEAGTNCFRYYRIYSSAIYSIKNEEANLAIDSLLRGGYLRLPMSLAIAAGTLRALCQERHEAGTNCFRYY